MTQKAASPEGKKSNTFLRALTDLVILALLLTGSGFGGYYWGIHQQLAPVAKVAPGTPGALPPSALTPSALPPAAADDAAKKGAAAAKGAATPATPAKTGSAAPSGAAAPAEATSAEESGKSKPHSAKKFWITSTGVDYMGYSITVKVNGTAVDSFFGPGKTIDVTRLVKPGQNTLVCDCKEMGDQYNKHSGDANSKLILQLVSGPHLSDSFKKSDVLLSYEKSAADSEDATDNLHFSGD